MGADNSAVSAEQQSDGAPHSADPLPLTDYGYLKKFIDDYLRMRLYDLTDENREIVAQAIGRYDGGEIVLPNELVTFLDEQFRINPL